MDPWEEWAACRAIDDAERLAARAETAALVLADACAALHEEAARELEKLDEEWRCCVTRLAAWHDRARAAHAGKPRLRQVRAARKWLKEACAELREERLRPFEDHSQGIWEELRQQSNVDLCSVRLTGSEKATVRKLVMDVSVDGTEAAALGVMSQGELHSLALSLFLPRAAAPDSPFGFVVIDDPVQSMDPAKVHGLAKVLHDLGQTRQVVVFTHDTRLQRAFTNQELPVTVLEVEREARSAVTVRRVTDPVGQALDDARALARTPNLPPVAITHVLPSLARTVLERAFSEAAWLRLHRAGLVEHEAEKIVTAAVKLMDIAALGLFGDPSRTAGRLPRAAQEMRPRGAGSHPAVPGGRAPVRHFDTGPPSVCEGHRGRRADRARAGGGHPVNGTIRQLLDTADLLIQDDGGSATTGPVTGGPAGLTGADAGAVVPVPPTALTATAASRCRGAAFALRAALESAVAARLTAHGAPRTIREGSMRAALPLAPRLRRSRNRPSGEGRVVPALPRLSLPPVRDRPHGRPGAHVACRSRRGRRTAGPLSTAWLMSRLGRCRLLGRSQTRRA